MARLRAVVHDERMNALIGWMLTGIVVLTAVESLLTDAFLWAGVALLVVVVAAVPAVVTSEWTMMVPWPLLLVAAVAMIVRRLGISVEIAGYFVVVALALIVVIELDAFTPVEMTRRFAVAFAALMTLAVQGVWTIAQYYSDQWLGTAFLHSQRELQLDIVVVTAIGITMAVVFEWYFEKVEHVGSHASPIASSE
ncbi:hypothetical protein ACFQKF_12275 [Halalkalicoccus sp. GCM10025322]|uniref:hypothetical protein n=1 Tax=Halalkalicoccus TaxID=332246 RepID=UPI002F960FE9